MSGPADSSRIRHDLRTPVNHIIGYSELLLEEESLPAEFRADLARIHAGGRRLLHLIKEYFDDERGAGGHPDWHRLHHELRTPVNHVIGYAELLCELADERGMAELRGDLEIIRQAAVNWLSLIERHLMGPGDGTVGAGPAEEPVGGMPAERPGAAERPGPEIRGRLLVIDDDADNRDLLQRRLSKAGHHVEVAADGTEGLRMLATGGFDVVLLDLVMPGFDGHQVLSRIKGDPALAETRVIMLSALDQDQEVAHCIEAGADDFLAKPFNPVFLRARLGACLEKKALRDREHRHVEEIRAQREKADRLLLNVLPRSIAARLQEGETMIADHFDEVTVLFADLVGFTPLSRTMEPVALVELLNEVFSRFDVQAGALGLEKIKTIGDSYMVAAGVPVPRPDHALAAARLALRMREQVQIVNQTMGCALNLRIGLHSGPLAAGIIGRDKFAYDVWGETVNTASRMEAGAPLNGIQLSAATAALVEDDFELVPRGTVEAKGIGPMAAFLLGAPRGWHDDR